MNNKVLLNSKTSVTVRNMIFVRGVSVKSQGRHAQAYEAK